MIEKYKQSIWRMCLVLAMSFVLALMMFMPTQAAEYNCGAYGAGNYNDGQVCASTTEEVADTGQPLAFIIPALAILAGVAMLYKLSRNRKKSFSSRQ